MKNVLILSESEDFTTNYVMDWVRYYGGNPIRFNIEEIDNHTIDIELGSELNMSLTFNGKTLKLDDINSYWYRRGGFNLKSYSSSIPNLNIYPEPIQEQMISHLISEKKELLNIIHFILEKKIKKKVGSYFSNINKFEVLMKAQEFGINIPNTYITDNKSFLKKILLKENDSIITKGIRDGLMATSDEIDVCYYTTKVEENEINSISNSFFPSLLQQNIEKEFEIRSTYLNGKFFSVAIFSQNDEKTVVDFRNYNNESKNRMVPFELPLTLQKKLRKIYGFFNLNLCSADIIKTKYGDYIFLEVNPVGQFGMISDPMNYNIEKELAKFLTS